MQTKKNVPVAIIAIGLALAAGVAFLLRRSDATEQPKGPDPKRVVNTGGGHVKGKADAKLTLVEYGDFQCPSCGYYHPIVGSLLDESPDLVKLEFHHFPLVQAHANAFPAALAAEAAGEQGKFFEMYDMLFQSQQSWSAKANAEEDFLVMAQKLGLDSTKFMQAMRSAETRERVIKDVTSGRELQVEGTPTFFINGRPIHPLPQTAQGFRQALQDSLGPK